MDIGHNAHRGGRWAMVAGLLVAGAVIVAPAPALAAPDEPTTTIPVDDAPPTTEQPTTTHAEQPPATQPAETDAPASTDAPPTEAPLEPTSPAATELSPADGDPPASAEEVAAADVGALAVTGCFPDPGYTDCVTYTYSGGDQSFTVPTGVSTVLVKAWGAGGGGSIASPTIGAPGGSGAYVQGVVPVTAGEAYAVVVGEGGGADGTAAASTRCAAAYGFGGACPPQRAGGGNYVDGGGGGGLSGLFTGTAAVGATDQARAVLVAGGGAGGEGTNGCGNTSAAGGAGGNGFAGGMPTMQGVAGALFAPTGGSNPTGGGGGYNGGNGPTNRLSNGSCALSANGGSNFLAATITSAADVAGNESPTRPDLTPNPPPRTTEAQYVAGVGVGQNALNTPGGNGLVVIQYALPMQPAICDGSAYLLVGVAGSTPPSTQLFRVSPDGTEYSLVATLAYNVNAVGYNPLDGFIYAYHQPSAAIGFTQLVRISPVDGVVQPLGTTPGAPAGGFSAIAAMNGNTLYVPAGNTLYRVDVTTNTIAGSTPWAAPSPSPFDFAFNPFDGFLYGYRFVSGTASSITRVDPTTGAVTQTNFTTPVDVDNGFGGQWFDGSGRLYGMDNSTGELWQISGIGTPTPVMQRVSDLATTGGGDGASCTPPDLLKDVNPDMAVPGQTVTYTYTLSNPTQNVLDDVTLEDLMPDDAADRTYVAGTVTAVTGTGGPVTGYTATISQTNRPDDTLSVTGIDVPAAGRVIITIGAVVSPTSPGGTVQNQALLTDLPGVFPDAPSDFPDTAAVDDPTPLTVLAPWVCASNAPAIQTSYNTNPPTSAFNIDLVTGARTPTFTVAGRTLNALGYNVADNFVYGWDHVANQVARVASDGTVQLLGAPPGMPAADVNRDWFAGDVDDSGDLWMFATDGSDRWFQIDLTTMTTVASGTAADGTLTAGADWSYIPGTNKLWRVAANAAGTSAMLVSFDRTTHLWSTPVSLGNLGGGTNNGTGATYIDAAGYLYAIFVNPVGQIYRIDPTTNAAVLFSSGVPAASGVDGTRCPSSPILIDLGDAPNTYATTLASNGPRHGIPGYDAATNAAPVMLGTNTIDPESDATPTAAADGDDASGVDDESGVVFNPALGYPSPTIRTGTDPAIGAAVVNTLDVTATANGFVSVWVDNNQDGDFADAGERVANAQAVTAGVNQVTFPLGANPANITSFVRVRYSTSAASIANPTGPAPDGEVEDYRVLVERLVAPQVCATDDTERFAFTFATPTSRTGTGGVGSTATFSNVAVVNGVPVDMFVEVIAGDMQEAGGGSLPPNGIGVGDAASGIGLDDARWQINVDATLRYSFFAAGTTTPVPVSAAFTVNDMDGTGTSSDETATFAAADLASYGVTQGSGVQITTSGSNVIFKGTTAGLGLLTQRFQFVLDGISTFDTAWHGFAGSGFGFDGDGDLTIAPVACEDYGDAPNNYATTAASNGARHTIVPGLQLGGSIDFDVNGQPTANADGDDLNRADDEDGVAPITLTIGSQATVNVTTTNTTGAVATLAGWIDLDRDGTFEASERVIAAVPHGSNAASIPLTFPATTTYGDAYARFRLFPGTVANPLPTGAASGGEVEDHRVTGPVPGTWPCSSDAYLFQYAANAGPTNVEAVNLVTGGSSTAHVLAGGAINATGYHVGDNFVYGWRVAPAELVRIGSNGGVQSLGLPANWASFPTQTATGFNSGVIDDDGYYWLGQGGAGHGGTFEWIKIDLTDPASPTYLQIVDAGVAPIPSGIANIGDWDFNVVDGNLYTLAATSAGAGTLRLIRFNLGTEQWEQVQTFSGLQAPNGVAAGAAGVGATFADADGNLYASENATGQIWRVDMNAPQATFFAYGPTVGFNDGARCFRAPIEIDFGDAADSYGTTLAVNGARHGVPGYDAATHTAPLMLGTSIDVEDDGVPTSGANGDDAADVDVDDEDAVAGAIAFSVGQPTTVPVTVTNDNAQPATLAAWADLDGSGVFEADELVRVLVGANSGTTSVNVPFGVSSAVCRNVRFRVYPGDVPNAQLSPTGPAAAGEVEDHPVTTPPACSPDDVTRTISGVAQAWTPGSRVQTGTYPASNAVNAPDGAGAQLYTAASPTNVLTLDMATVVPEGYVITVQIARLSGYGGAVRLSSSADGVTFAGSTDQTVGQVLPAYEAVQYIVPAGGARFIRIVPILDGATHTAVRVDAATYSFEYCECEDAANFVQNGTFEEFTNCTLHSDTLGAWRVIEDSIHVWGSTCPLGWDSPEGDKSVDLDGADRGGMEQTITGLTAGNSYNLTFYMAFNPAAGAASSSMRVTVGDFDETYTAASNATLGGFNLVHVQFTADSDTELLRFQSLTGTANPNLLNGGGTRGFGVVIDDVRITPLNCDEVLYRDFGDAPNTYGTTSAAGGPSHAIPGYDPVTRTAPLMMGTNTIDPEADGVPTVAADGDDLAGVDDESGVAGPIVVTPGQSTIVPVTVVNTSGAPATLVGWIDYNANGVFDTTEQASAPVPNGTATVVNLTFNMPAGATSSAARSARLRLFPGTVTGALPTGPAGAGEVEDYPVTFSHFDFGDAPATYGTLLADDGARHASVGATPLRLGPSVDLEGNGFPGVAATGDDTNGADDENGIQWASDVSVPGRNESVYVSPNAAGRLNGWIDFNRNGVFEASEHVINEVAVVAGQNVVHYQVPTGAAFVPGATYARFRLTSATAQGNTPTGFAPNGEVEDYTRTLFDAPGEALVLCPAGSAPVPVSIVQNPSFETRTGNFQNNSANNTINFAQNWFDSHATGGQYHYFNPPTFDSGPVATTMPIRAGADGFGFLGGHTSPSTQPVTNDAGEGATNTLAEPLIPGARYVGFFSQAVGGYSREGGGYWRIFGTNNVNVGHIGPSPGVVAPTASNVETLYNTPTMTYPGVGVADTWEVSTFTLTPSQPWQFLRLEARNANPAANGTVAGQAWMSMDDFHMYLCEPPVDFGDAPNTFGTTEAANGPRHTIQSFDPATNTSTLMIGATVDDEDDGAASTAADGDDLANADDEDGVLTTIGFQPGSTTATLTVPVINATGAAATLYGWVDANNNGSFQAGELTSIAVPNGATSVTLNWTGLTALLDGTQPMVRLRLTSAVLTDNAGTAAVDERALGAARDGEVEDHRALVATPFPVSCTAPFTENFGAGPGRGPALPTGQTTYTYDASGPVVDGLYTIIANPASTGGAWWHSGADHTPGDTDGRMMTINASVTPGLFFQRTFTGLVAGGAYDFSAWIANANNFGSPSLPNVTFRVINPANGAVLASVNTGNIPNAASLLWNRYALQFTATQATVRLEMVNNSPGGNGNDLTIDDIAFAQVCEFGDAPASYGTTLATNGPGHVAGGPTIGTARDTESNGQPSAGADGDDANGTDDEDGTASPVVLAPGEPSTVTISATNNSAIPVTLAGWVDLNGNGTFDAAERVTVTVPASSGTANYPLTFPAGTTVAATYARFRIYNDVVADPLPTGIVGGGEVEDYPVAFATTTIDKDLATVVPNGDGTSTLNYTLTVTRTGAPGTYNLTDTLQYGSSVTVLGRIVTPPAGVTANAGWNGVGDITVASAVAIGAGVTHVYTVAVTVAVDESMVTFTNSDCPIGAGETGSGFSNTATVTAGSTTVTDSDCEPFPAIDIDKEPTGPAASTGPNQYTVTFELTVSNAGAGAGTYDLADQLALGAGVSVVTATLTPPAGVTPIAGWDGEANTAIVDDQPIAPATAGGSTTHVYTVTVVVTVDPAITVPASNCTLEPGELGTGLTNSATVTTNGEPVEDTGCVPVPVTRIDKELTDVTPNGDGTYTLTYLLTVERYGLAGVYDLHDDLMLGAPVTVVGSPTVVNNAPGTVPINPTFDGDTDTLIAGNVVISAGAAHTYTLTVVADVDPSQVTSANADCTLAAGETGTGAMNQASLELDNTTFTDTECQPFPAIAVDKAVTSGPTAEGNGEYSIEYTLTVTNTGPGAGEYDLDDALAFGDGVNVLGSDIASTTGQTPNPAWDGVGVTGVATGEPIAGAPAGGEVSHTYVVTVTFTVDADVTATAADCDLETGESGTGLRNNTTLGGDFTDTDDDCVPAPTTTFTKELASVTPNGDGTFTLVYDLTVTRTGAGDPYTLTDELQYGPEATVDSVTITAAPAGVTTNPAFDGVADTTMASNVDIADGDTHVYEITVVATVDPAGVTAATSDCPNGGPEPGSGFSNTAAVVSNGETDTSGACERYPAITMTKDLTAGPTPVGGGGYQYVYTVTVQNAGAGAGTYDLADELDLGDGVTLVSANVTNAIPGTIVDNPAWNGVADTAVVTNEPIAGATVLGPTVHTYIVTIVVQPDPDLTPTAADCTVDPGETGTGAGNTATITSDNGSAPASDCGEVPVTTFDKVLMSATANGDGTYTLVYDLTVHREGDGAPYTLTDTLNNSPAVTVNSVGVTATNPAGLVTNPAFDGQSDPTVASNVTIGAGETHVYTLTVQATLDGSAVTFSNSDCPAPVGGPGSGFANTAAVTTNGETDADDACTPLPGTSIDKEITAGPSAVGNGQYDITYTLTVTNVGAGADVYDLADTLALGAGVTVVNRTVTPPAGVTANPAWTGLAPDTALATDVPIAGAVDALTPTEHVYTVVVRVQVPAGITAAAADCTDDAGETGTGLSNSASLAGNGGIADDEECTPIPTTTIDKAVQSVLPHGDGTYTLTYTLTVSRTGDGGVYDLSDELQMGPAVTVVDATAANTAPGGITVNPDFDGQADQVIASAVPIGDGDVHVYTVTVEATVDAAAVTFAGSDCPVAVGEAGSGLADTASLTVNGVTTTDDACEPFSAVTLDKDIASGPTGLGNGRYEIVYTLTATNTGAGGGVYTLADDLQLGSGVTVESASVTNTAPGGILTNPLWDGDTVTQIVANQPIGAATAGGPTVHTYQVTVVVAIDDDITPSAADCTDDAGETGTGLSNSATITGNAGPDTAEDCAPVPITAFDKALVGTTAHGDGTYTLVYELTVTRSGTGAPYALTDTLNFGSAVTVDSVAVTATSPAGLTTNPAFDGQTDTTVASAVAIGDGQTHVYTITVEATVDGSAVTFANSACPAPVGGPGSGFANRAAVTTNDEIDADEDCAPLPGTSIDKQITAGPSELGDGRYEITYTLTATNVGQGDDAYDLTDTLALGAGITVVSAQVEATSPTTLPVIPGWNGTSNVAVASAVPIAGAVDAATPTVHVYTVTLVVDVPDGLAPAAGDCVEEQGETGTGLSNSASLSGGAGPSADEDCAPVPVTDVQKVIQSVVPHGDGSYTLTYVLTVSRTGAAGSYDLTDTLLYGPAVTIDTVTVTNTTPGGITTNPAFDGQADPSIAAGVPIGDGDVHVYTVTVEAAVDAAEVTFDGSDCPVTVGETGSGFANSASIDVNGTTITDDACAPLSAVSVDKTIASGPTPLGNGQYQIVYDLVASNSGAGAGVYSLDDELQFGTGVSVVSATVANTTPGGIAINLLWDGVATTQIVTGQSIDPATAGGPSTHTYRVTVVVDIDPAITPAAADCTTAAGEDGTGLSNTATVGGNSGPATDDECTPVPVSTVDKQLVSVTPNGDGTLTVAYTLTVTQSGAAGVYDLADTLQYGPSVTILSQAATDPAGEPITAWNGTTVTQLADDVAIAAGTSDVYDVTVLISVDETTVTTSNGDCTIGDNEAGSGLFNSATVTVNGDPITDTDCRGIAGTTVSKSVTAGPTPTATAGEHEVEYTISVSNAGAVADTYTLDDALQYGTGVTVTSAAVTSAPAGVTPSVTWNGQGDTRIVTGQSIPADTTHDYIVTVRYTTAADITAAAADCDTATGGSNTGLLNSTTATVDGEPHTGADCVEPPITRFDKEFVGATPLPSGEYRLTYRLTVTRVAGDDATYDLDDDLQLGDPISVVDAGVSIAPAGVTPSSTWNGDTDTRIATGVTITEATPHVYEIVVVVSVDPAEVTDANSDCVLGQGEGGTGAMNSATLAVDGAAPITDTDCREFPATIVEKAVSAGPTPVGGGVYEVEYTLTVSNVGAGNDTYTLTDDLQYGTGITIVGATAANVQPGSIVVNDAFDGTTDPLIVTGQPIADGEVHEYTVTVRFTVDAAISDTALNCTLEGNETGTGLRNHAAVQLPGDTVRDADGCVEPPVTRFDKELSSVLDQGGGTTLVTYTLTVSQLGSDGAYTLVDALHFSDAVSVEYTSVNDFPAGVTPNGAWNGTTDPVVAADVPITAGSVHSYTLFVEVSVDEEAVTAANSDCEITGGETGSGLSNTAAAQVNGVDVADSDCQSFPGIVVHKDVVSGPTPVGDGQYDLVYEITVANNGGAPGSYDLDDQLHFGAGIDVVSAAVVNTVPGGLVTNNGWNGLGVIDVIDDVDIDPGAAHVYTVTVRADVPVDVAAGAADCTSGGGESGTGLSNTATATTNGEPHTDDACAPAPVTTFDKTLVSAVPNGDGSYTITYDLAVGRTGSAVPYQVSDTLRFGAGTTVVSAGVSGTTPGGLAVNGAWNGTTNTVVADNVIADGQTHTYRVVVVADIDPSAVPAGASDCTLAGAESGTGFSNTAGVTSNDVTSEDSSCAPFAVVQVAKDITAGPAAIGNDQQQVTYTLTVTNVGGGAGTYNLTDTLTYSGAVTVVGTTVANATPGGIATNPGWNGQGDTSVVAGQAIGAGETHSYTVTVTVTVAAGISDSQGDCTLSPGEGGTGLLNQAQVNSNGDTDADDACVAVSSLIPPPPPPPPTTGPPATPPTGELPRTGGNSAPILQIALVLLLAGTAVVLITRRRRRSTAS